MRIGISLSGGGARGIAHIGVLQALEDNNIYPDIISGTSAGSIVGALYASGKTPQEMLHFVEKSSYYRVIRPSMSGGGITSLDYLRDHLSKYIKHDSFESLNKPLYVAVSNLTYGELEIVNSGKLFEIIMASSAVPLIFKPVLIGDCLYSDGGLFDNMPVKPIRNLCDFVIGVSVIPHAEMSNKNVSNMVGIAARVFDLAIWNAMRPNFALCDVLIEPNEILHYSPFNFKRVQELYDVGYRATIAKMEDIKRLIQDFDNNADTA